MNLALDNDIVSLSDCKVGENVSFVIPIYNDGKYPLKISKIFTSCSCLSLIDHTKEFVVSPKDSVMVRFNFRSEESGEVSTYGFGLCGIFICIAAGYVCGSSTVYPSAVWNYNAFKDNFCIRKPGS